jgi:hypothetical protein
MERRRLNKEKELWVVADVTARVNDDNIREGE